LGLALFLGFIVITRLMGSTQIWLYIPLYTSSWSM